MLVEIQLATSQQIKETIDRAWGVQHNKHKKRDPQAQPDNSGPSQESLMTVPIAQDNNRLRYWSFDGEYIRCHRPNALLMLCLWFVLLILVLYIFDAATRMNM